MTEWDERTLRPAVDATRRLALAADAATGPLSARHPLSATLHADLPTYELVSENPDGTWTVRVPRS